MSQKKTSKNRRPKAFPLLWGLRACCGEVPWQRWALGWPSAWLWQLGWRPRRPPWGFSWVTKGFQVGYLMFCLVFVGLLYGFLRFWWYLFFLWSSLRKVFFDPDNFKGGRCIRVLPMYPCPMMEDVSQVESLDERWAGFSSERRNKIQTLPGPGLSWINRSVSCITKPDSNHKNKWNHSEFVQTKKPCWNSWQIFGVEMNRVELDYFDMLQHQCKFT